MADRVVFINPIMTHYREKFHTLVRDALARAGVIYEPLYSAPYGSEVAKGDTIDLPWSYEIPARHFGADGRLLWQAALRRSLRADLIIIGQENRFLLNYVLQSIPRRLRPRLAMWGHGRNFQARNPDSRSEKWKRFWATKVDWWFGYTEESCRHIASLGFPPDRITSANNSVDTSQLRALAARVTPERLSALRDELGIAGRHVGVFVGGIYPDKRMAFLIEAADHIRERVPDFELLVVGSGSDLPVVEALAKSRPWVRVLGPRFGQDKVELMMLGHVFMMPGLMGLAILDAGVMGLPIATTAYPWHSPEIAYLQPGVSGLVVDDWENPLAYGREVADLLRDPVRLRQIGLAARDMAARYSIEGMAENFANGILKALAG